MSWGFQVNDYLDNAGAHLPETQKIVYAASLLRGHAQKWWQYRKIGAKDNSEVMPSTWQQLREELESTYKPINDARLARDKLATLRQTGSVQALIYAFRTLCLRIPDMNEGEKMDRFLRALKPHIQKELEVKEVTKFEDACLMAERIDRITYAGNKGNQRSGNTYRTTERATSAHGPTPMELGALNASSRRDGSKPRYQKLTPEEREELRRTGRCFYCRQPNHRALDCPQRPKLNGSKGNGRTR